MWEGRRYVIFRRNKIMLANLMEFFFSLSTVCKINPNILDANFETVTFIIIRRWIQSDPIQKTINLKQSGQPHSQRNFNWKLSWNNFPSDLLFYGYLTIHTPCWLFRIYISATLSYKNMFTVNVSTRPHESPCLIIRRNQSHFYSYFQWMLNQ